MMPLPHLLLALLVVLIWGMNFLFVSFGLEELPPLLLCALRFLFTSIPAVFFVKIPASSFKIIALYGLVMFALQFGLLFIGMNMGMPTGLASLLMQTQVFFSMFFAVIFLGEQPNLSQISGALVAFMGIGLVAMHFDAEISLVGFMFILAAAATWGMGNLITKKIKGTNNTMAIIAWGSCVACIPMFLFSMLFEGSTNLVSTVVHLSWRAIFSLLYIVFASTWIGYGLWNWLIARYPVGMVAPFTLLVPIVAILSSVLVLDEPFQSWKLVAGLLVIGGLGINILGPRFFSMRRSEAI